MSCLTQFEQLELANAFEFTHDRFVAKGVVVAYPSGTLLRREPEDQGDEARQAVFGRRGSAFLDFGIKHQTHVGDPVGMDGVTGSLRLDVRRAV